MKTAFSAPKKGRKSRAKVRRRPAKAASVLRWVRAARRRGVAGPGLVYELHVRRGLALPEVAVVLRASLREVRRHWRKHCAEREGVEMAARPPRILPPLAPQSEGDLVALREQVSVALWETVVETFGGGTGNGERGEGAAPEPPMLSVRLRALRQMSGLYGLDCRSGANASAEVRVACARPEEIAEMVRERRRGV